MCVLPCEHVCRPEEELQLQPRFEHTLSKFNFVACPDLRRVLEYDT